MANREVALLMFAAGCAGDDPDKVELCVDIRAVVGLEAYAYDIPVAITATATIAGRPAEGVILAGGRPLDAEASTYAGTLVGYDWSINIHADFPVGARTFSVSTIPLFTMAVDGNNQVTWTNPDRVFPAIEPLADASVSVVDAQNVSTFNCGSDCGQDHLDLPAWAFPGHGKYVVAIEKVRRFRGDDHEYGFFAELHLRASLEILR